MSKQKSLKAADSDLVYALVEWIQAKKRFEGENDLPEKRRVPYDIPRRIGEAADHIVASVRILRRFPEEETDGDLMFSDLQHLGRSIMKASIDIGESLDDGTDDMIDHCEHPRVFVSWQGVCVAVEELARAAAQELKDLQPKYRGVSDSGLIYAAGIMEDTAKEALRCRKRGITGHLEGSLSEYALEDAKSLGFTTRNLEDLED